MELTRGRGLSSTVMAKVEVPTDMKEEKEVDVMGLRPLENFF